MALIASKSRSVNRVTLDDMRSFLDFGKKQFEWQAQNNNNEAADSDSDEEGWLDEVGDENLAPFECLREIRNHAQTAFGAVRLLQAVGHIGQSPDGIAFKPCAPLIRFSRRFCAGKPGAAPKEEPPAGMEQAGRALLILLDNQVSGKSSFVAERSSAGKSGGTASSTKGGAGGCGNFSMVHIKRTITKRVVPRLVMFNPVSDWPPLNEGGSLHAQKLISMRTLVLEPHTDTDESTSLKTNKKAGTGGSAAVPDFSEVAVRRALEVSGICGSSSGCADVEALPLLVRWVESVYG